MVNGPFTGYAFSATGASTTRTMPDRISDIINVKEFGAKGDGITNDSSAIQEAINYAYALNSSGACVFLPAGTYIVDSIEMSNAGAGFGGGLVFMGAGRDATILKGTNPGNYVLNRFPVGGNSDNASEVRDMTVWNQSTASGSGALGWGWIANTATVTNCHFIGFYGLNMATSYENFGMSIRDCICTCNIPVSRADSISPGPTTGTIGIISGQGEITNCSVTGFDVGIATSRYAFNVTGCQITACNAGIDIGGGNPAGSSVLFINGAGVIANDCQRCATGVVLYGVSGALVAANTVSGSDGPADPAPISNITWAAGIATVTVPSGGHNISGSQKLALITSPAGWTPDRTGDQLVTCTPTTSAEFTYSLSSDPGSFSSATWNYPIVAGIWKRSTTRTTIASNMLSATVSDKSINMSNPSAIEGQNICMAMKGPYGWTMPDSIYQGSWEFINCGSTNSPPTPFLTYANMLYPIEGQEYNIIDGPAGSTFATIISTGASVNHMKVRFDGTDWRRIG